MSHRITLAGLIGSHPLGALASFGLLRKLSESDDSAQLAFTMEDDWVAVAHTSEIHDASGVVEYLCEWATSGEIERMLNWTDEDVRVQPSVFQQAIRAAVVEDDRGLADCLTALAADGAVDLQKQLVKPSAFYMVSGQQSFLNGLREIVAQVRANPRPAFEEALNGPWRYRMQAHSLGWDPRTERLHALRHRAPTAEKPVCIGGAVLLAFWALPLFPSVANGGRVATTGFTRAGRDQYFNWPIWSVPISLGELKSLLHTGPSSWMSADARRPRRGIAAVYRSRRAEFGQGYAILRTPEIVSSGDVRGS